LQTVLKHPRRLIQLPLLAVALFCALADPAAAQLVSRFEVAQTVISPEGDGRQDTTRVRYALADTALWVSVVVLEADSVTPVDTLRAPAPDEPPQNRDYAWKGLRWDGTPAPEGTYVVMLNAIGKSDPDSVLYLPVFVDVTPPRVQILSAIPNPYAPGLAGVGAVDISHVVSDTSPVAPGRVADRLDVAFAGPSGAPVAAAVTTAPPFTGGDGLYVTSWDATEAATTLVDGEYAVTLTLVDAAGYTVRTSYHFEIDTGTPVIGTTNLADNARVQVVPDSLYGWAYDSHAVDSLYVRYLSSPYQLVTGTQIVDDSLRFALPLADSIPAEGTYTLALRAIDGVGRASTLGFRVTWDVTRPAAPRLDAFTGSWRGERYPLSGSVDNGGDASSIVRVYRNGTPVDSAATVLSANFTVQVPLVPGRNELVARQRDGAGNLSAPSNEVVVTFQSAAGLFFPVPFAPGGTFQLNADRVARTATLRVFDVAGDLVTLFEDGSARQYYTFTWNGRNSSDRDVRRGPLVAVATITYDDGAREIFREVFLFDSSP
jgi:hypothetical protein